MSRGRYINVMGPRVADKLRELAEDPARHSLDEEVDVARVLALDAAKMYELAFSSDKASETSKAMASSLLRDGINNVASLVERSIKVKAQSQELIRLDTFKFLMAQVETIIRGRLGAEAGAALCEEISSHVRFQSPVQLTVE